jgi:hypothetical protein
MHISSGIWKVPRVRELFWHFRVHIAEWPSFHFHNRDSAFILC